METPDPLNELEKTLGPSETAVAIILKEMEWRQKVRGPTDIDQKIIDAANTLKDNNERRHRIVTGMLLRRSVGGYIALCDPMIEEDELPYCVMDRKGKVYCRTHSEGAATQITEALNNAAALMTFPGIMDEYLRARTEGQKQMSFLEQYRPQELFHVPQGYRIVVTPDGKVVMHLVEKEPV